MCSKGPAGLARRRRFTNFVGGGDHFCCRRDDSTTKPGPERALKASLTSTAPPLQLLAAALEASAATNDDERVPWDADVAVVSASQNVSTDDVLQARVEWCRVLADCVQAASSALDASSAGTQRSDERAWSLVALRRLAEASRQALDVAESSPLNRSVAVGLEKRRASVR